MPLAEVPVSWHVELAVKPGALERFRALTAEMVDFAQGEAGVLAYERYVSPDGTLVHVYERWADSPSAVDHLRAFAERFAGRFSRLVERRRFTVYGDPSEDLQRLLRGVGATDFLLPLEGFAKGIP